VIRPSDLSPAERLIEIGEILALAVVRLRGEKSSEIAVSSGESSLDCVLARSGREPSKRRDLHDGK
jgi:hypothetical protein